VNHQEVHRVWSPELEIEAWLVIDSMQDGLSFGGARFRCGTTEAEVRELARSMSWKLAGHGPPIGGAKAGFACDPGHPALPAFLKLFAQTLRPILQSRVILGKDLGASDALLDLLYREVGSPQLAPVRAKHPGGAVPSRLRDLVGYRRHMTGLGLAVACDEALGEDLCGQRVLIQGFGAVGAGSAARLVERGAVVVGVSDISGSVINPAGLPLDLLLSASAPDGHLDRAKLAELGDFASCDALFSVDADLLVIAASSHSVTAELASGVKTAWVAEGANFGLTPEARSVLHRRGVRVLPDILANSAAAAMACRQMACGNLLDEGALWDAITGSIRENTRRAIARAQADRCTLRTAWLRLIEGEQ